jgi:hypothetical protein
MKRGTWSVWWPAARRLRVAAIKRATVAGRRITVTTDRAENTVASDITPSASKRLPRTVDFRVRATARVSR